MFTVEFLGWCKASQIIARAARRVGFFVLPVGYSQSTQFLKAIK